MNALQRLAELHASAPSRSNGLYAHTRETFVESFNARLVRNDSNGCLEWAGRLSEKGYGMANVPAFMDLDQKSKPAHRMAWLLFVGPIPDELYVCHRCNNKKCCDLNHLYLATHRQNIADAARDGLMGNKGSGVCKQGHVHGLKKGDCPMCASIAQSRRHKKNPEKRRAVTRKNGKVRYWARRMAGLPTQKGRKPLPIPAFNPLTSTPTEATAGEG